MYTTLLTLIIQSLLCIQVVDMLHKKVEYFDSMLCNNPKYWKVTRYVTHKYIIIGAI